MIDHNDAPPGYIAIEAIENSGCDSCDQCTSHLCSGLFRNDKTSVIFKKLHQVPGIISDRSNNE